MERQEQMSTVINDRFKMRCKSVIYNLLIVVGLLVEPSTAIVKPKGYLEAYIYIRKHPIILTYISPGIYPSLSSSFFSSVC